MNAFLCMHNAEKVLLAFVITISPFPCSLCISMHSLATHPRAVFLFSLNFFFERANNMQLCGASQANALQTYESEISQLLKQIIDFPHPSIYTLFFHPTNETKIVV